MQSSSPLTHEVHVWYVALDRLTQSQIEQCADALSTDERQRRDRFVFERDRLLYQVAHALVRLTLSRYVSVDPRSWRFVPNRYGRPEIVAPADHGRLRFNLSHTPGLATVAVAVDREIGVDVENVERRAASLKIADHYFSPAEVADLKRLPPQHQHEAFFDYWTLKESYIKARGMGLSIPLDQFSFRLVKNRPIEIAFGPELVDEPSSWQFVQRTVADCYKIAVAIRRRGNDIPVRWYETDLFA